jgi:HAD superfamily hydrolase (TIGR01549 family)
VEFVIPYLIFLKRNKLVTTLLLDLDDTLLINPVDQFIPTYLRLFAIFVSDLVDPKQFSNHLLYCTDCMIANNTIDQTLKQTFDKVFFPFFAEKQAQLEERIDCFYKEQFPSLEKLTKPRKEAIQLIEFAFNQGMNVVVATNPIFPMQAQLQRLDWAGLSLKHYPFKLVTSYESLHFAKPNPAYYAEILAQLGWPDGPVCMIGDNLSDDILPAAMLGISTLLLSNPWHPINDVPTAIPYMPLNLVEKWISNTTYKTSFSNQESIFAALRASLAAIHSRFADTDAYQYSNDIQIRNLFSSWVDQENNLLSSVIDKTLLDSTFANSQLAEELSVLHFFTAISQRRTLLLESLRHLDNLSFERFKPILQQMIEIDQNETRQIINHFTKKY